MKNEVLKIATEDLSKAMHYFSAYISHAPKKYYHINAWRKNAQMVRRNEDYSRQLTTWKNEKLFPFFLENGYNKKQLSLAQKMKSTYTFKFDPELLNELQKEAKKENRSFNNYVETLLLNHPERTLKKVKIINPK